MAMKKIYPILCCILITTLTVSLLVAAYHKGPVYIYTQDLQTGKCTVRDSAMRYTPVAHGTPSSFPILGNIGNTDGLGTCDTLYVTEDDRSPDTCQRQ